MVNLPMRVSSENVGYVATGGDGSIPVYHYKGRSRRSAPAEGADMRNAALTSVLSLALLAFLASATWAQPAAEQFKGETINIEIGYGPGGGYDTYGRTLARHFGRFIPGNPAVVAKNMPGAGSLRAANYIYNLAPKDGTELGVWAASTIMEPLMGNDQAKFDAAKFSWIGSMNQDISFCGLWVRPGAPASFADMLQRETIFGSAGQASISYQHPLILKNLLGAKLKVLTGYAGTREVNLAMQRGEVDGACGLFVSSIKSQYLSDVQQGRLKLAIQMGPKKTDEFGPVPDVFDFAKSDEDRQVLELHFKQTLLGRPVAGPPEMPKRTLDSLRAAFMQTMADPEFLADAKKVNIDIDPAPAAEVEKLLAQFADYPERVIQKARAAIGR
jgi:tripartite-type tricarboxylate transporter receptor subunit TctC